MKVKYRVVLEIGYFERWFEFASLSEAGTFAKMVLERQVPSEDHKNKPLKITMEVVNADLEEEIEKAEKEVQL